jgi:N-dimethylarginine dimethylaminohydrolase
MSATVAANAHQKAMTSAATPSFAEQVSAVWGYPWGATDEVGKLRRVLVRAPGDELAVVRADAWQPESQALVDPAGRWYWTDQRPPDLDLVHAQHAGLVQTLRQEGVEVDVAPPMGGHFTKAVYMRDPLITTPNGAIIGRMGVQMRRGEEPDVARFVAGLGMPIVGTITGTGTLEGGSYCKLQPDLHVLGTSIRCNRAGAEQLRTLLSLMDIELLITSVPGWSIHIDLHMALVDVDKVLVDAERLPYEFLMFLRERGFELIEADPSEAWGLNLLCLRPGRVLMADGSPRSAEKLSQAGVEVVTIAYDEIQKNGGGIHCSTMELARDRADGQDSAHRKDYFASARRGRARNRS